MTARPGRAGQEQPAYRVWALAALFVTSGVLHFVRPGPFEAIVPRGLPARRELVYLSGAAELACAAGLTHRRTRPWAGLASAGLLVAVLPANVQMTADIFRRLARRPGSAGSRRATVIRTVAVMRLPLQLPLVQVGWRAFRSR